MVLLTTANQKTYNDLSKGRKRKGKKSTLQQRRIEEDKRDQKSDF